jgi:hypothetical protein
MDVELLQTYIGVDLNTGVSCGPGTLINIFSGSGLGGGSMKGQLANHSTSLWAHGFALTSGSGTKVAGIAQRVRIDRVGKVSNVDYITMTPGQTVYLGAAGKYAIATTTSQRVGFSVGANEVFVDLDMELGDRTS